MTRCICFQPDRLSCRIEKVSAKDGEMDCRNTNRPVRYHGRIGFTSHERELLVIHESWPTAFYRQAPMFTAASASRQPLPDYSTRSSTATNGLPSTQASKSRLP